MPAEERARRYHRLQLALAAIGLSLGVVYLVAVLATGVARHVADAAARIVAGWWWQVAAVTLVLGAGHALLAFPLTWLRGYALPRRYGLLHQPLAAWLGDRAKAVALGGGVALAGIEVVSG
jgi:STE24 endopeptidase